VVQRFWFASTRTTDTDDFRLLAGYEAPIWVRNSVFYQIFPDRFADGDPAVRRQQVIAGYELRKSVKLDVSCLLDLLTNYLAGFTKFVTTLGTSMCMSIQPCIGPDIRFWYL